MSGETTETRRVTRSMSGTTKKTDSKIVVNDKQKASNKAKSGRTKIIRTPGCSCAPKTWKDEAYGIFVREYKEKHYKPPPFPTGQLIPKELRLAIMQAWRDMSDREKAPYMEHAKKIEAERVKANSKKMIDELRAKGLL